MIYTKEIYEGMIGECKGIAAVFIKDVAARRSMLDPVNDIDDIDDWELAEEEIKELFEKFKTAMGLNCSLGFFRDNDVEHGKYGEDGDVVLLPLCIGCYKETEIVAHMTHELYHAFQYYSICEPDDYPCFDAETINTWDYEFHNYESGAKDMKQYLGQEIEKTARKFGEMLGKCCEK